MHALKKSGVRSRPQLLQHFHPPRSCLDVWPTPNDSLRRSPHEFLTVTCLLYPQHHYHMPLPSPLSLFPPSSRPSSATGQGKTGNACALFSLPLTGSLTLSLSYKLSLALSLPLLLQHHSYLSQTMTHIFPSHPPSPSLSLYTSTLQSHTRRSSMRRRN